MSSARIYRPSFVKTSPKRSVSMTENQLFGLVFAKTVYKFGHMCCIEETVLYGIGSCHKGTRHDRLAFKIVYKYYPNSIDFCIQNASAWHRKIVRKSTNSRGILPANSSKCAIRAAHKKRVVECLMLQAILPLPSTYNIRLSLIFIYYMSN